MGAYEKTDGGRVDLKIVYFGTGPFGLPSFQSLVLHRVAVKLVVTAPDRPAGRGRRIKPLPIKSASEQAGISTLQPVDVNDPYIVQQIRGCGADLGVLIAYGQKIGPELIRSFPKGIINLHGSLLPRYRGAAPINWAIINGEQETGVTVTQLNEQFDAGMILSQVSVKIKPTERADELHDRLAELGPAAVLDVIMEVQKGTVRPVSQDLGKVSKAPKLKKSQGHIDWSRSASNIANLIRGLWPWPAVKAVYRPQEGKCVKVSFARARALSGSHAGHTEPGVILPDLSISCGTGRLEVMELKPAGGKLMSWPAFVNGRHVKPADRFARADTED